jgi:hypothetical protein
VGLVLSPGSEKMFLGCDNQDKNIFGSVRVFISRFNIIKDCNNGNNKSGNNFTQTEEINLFLDEPRHSSTNNIYESTGFCNKAPEECQK